MEKKKKERRRNYNLHCLFLTFTVSENNRMPKEMSNRYLLLYGSQTGQAMAIAEEIFQRSSDHGLQPDLHCLSMVDKKVCKDKWRTHAHTHIVQTNRGDGNCWVLE